MPHSPRFEFGPFQLDSNDRLLTRAGEVVSLRPKATEILVRLVTNAGQLIKKDELLKEVWPDTFVEEANLSQTIFTLRKALGDDRSEPTYIETVPRRGYRFVAAVKNEEAPQDHPSPAVPIAPQPHVVAVLPFLNQTGNPEFDYLADGIANHLIISRLSKIHVLSHSAVSAFKTTSPIPQHFGKELGATVILFGRLNSRPTGIAIGVELVDASTGWQLWADASTQNHGSSGNPKHHHPRLTKAVNLKLSNNQENKSRFDIPSVLTLMKRIWKLADIGAFILAAVSKKLLCTLNRLLNSIRTMLWHIQGSLIVTCDLRPTTFLLRMVFPHWLAKQLIQHVHPTIRTQ